MSGETELRRLLTQKGMGRREFMERAAALGAGTALATSMAGRAFAQTPQKGGHLKLGIDSAGATDSLDPATYTANYMQTVGYQWGNPLVELDENNQTIPELAESWEPNDDATQWVFKAPAFLLYSFSHQSARSASKPLGGRKTGYDLLTSS
jgi:peptide/nickel transport system substrate-binding protein